MAKRDKPAKIEDTQRHDRNEVALRGVLTTAPEHRVFGSGASLARLLVTIRLSAPRSRTDVIPVTVWEPDAAVIEAERGTPVDVIGQVHRRFWTDAEGRHSRVEVVATEIELGNIEATA
jgi:single-stranded DNA-binding protein